MTKEQSRELEEHFNRIDENGNLKPGTRAMIFSALDNLYRIEETMEAKDRTSKKAVKLELKEAKRKLFEALKDIKGD